jgi:hypothetical protein
MEDVDGFKRLRSDWCPWASLHARIPLSCAAPSVLCVVQRGAEACCGGDQRPAVFERDLLLGVRRRPRSSVSDQGHAVFKDDMSDMQSLKETCKETCGLACEGAQTKIRQQPSSK